MKKVIFESEVSHVKPKTKQRKRTKNSLHYEWNIVGRLQNWPAVKLNLNLSQKLIKLRKRLIYSIQFETANEVKNLELEGKGKKGIIFMEEDGTPQTLFLSDRLASLVLFR